MQLRACMCLRVYVNGTAFQKAFVVRAIANVLLYPFILSLAYQCSIPNRLLLSTHYCTTYCKAVPTDIVDYYITDQIRSNTHYSQLEYL